MVRRLTQVTVVAIGLAIIFGAFPSSSAAITGNYVKDFEHPYVGLVVLYDAEGEFLGRCSGALLTDIVFLTAGHCTEGASTARVYFQQDAGANYDPEKELDPVTGYPDTCAPGTLGTVCATSDQLYTYGTPVIDPVTDDFAAIPDTKDLGLVILDQPIDRGEFGALAGAGTLDVLATRRGRQDLTITVSGYGVTKINPVHELSFRERLMATAKLVNLGNSWTNGFNIQTTNNPGNDRGGTCFGDSGGPFFYGPTVSNLIVAVNSFGLAPHTCTGVDFAYRIDTTATLAWILATVPDSEISKIQIVTAPSKSLAAVDAASVDAPVPSADERAKDTGKDKSKKRGKAKGEQHQRGKGGKAKGQRHR
jgi:Trypsin